MKILIADDDAVNRRFLQTRLAEWGYEVEVVKDGAEAWRALQAEDGPRFAILDWMMPGIDGVDVIKEVRKRNASNPYIYILLLTSRKETEFVVEGMEAGADDYITKPFSPDELKARLRAGRRILELEQRLQFEATHDPLTGLWNRRAVLEILQREIDRAVRERTSLAVAMADLDRFKQINDTRGHQMGDEVLREAARSMRGALRSYDALGRYGGEEFLMVLPGCDQPAAVGLAERVWERIRTTPFAVPWRVTISVGVAVCHHGNAPDVSALINAADSALFKAKGQRDCVEVAVPFNAGPLP